MQCHARRLFEAYAFSAVSRVKQIAAQEPEWAVRERGIYWREIGSYAGVLMAILVLFVGVPASSVGHGLTLVSIDCVVASEAISKFRCPKVERTSKGPLQFSGGGS